ncbi:response regulator [Myceligenerans xiligouense]|uniref:LuxR family two component transcriptional regulator n=1 Tax=Myceligenerans xiligouense TaxID=253184 RepID=A0A3N4ZBR8_9MICO|nr:response regulator transcription factor [Myceligenerans xiligouense]RPF23328.1 LuxR family two component transcriptional regulator [Myceligenerans xiligouense]
MIRVLLVDDQHLVRSGFSLILSVEDDIEVVGEAADGAEAVNLARELRPDVVLMDVQMPVMDGIEATRHVVTDDLAKVLVLTTFDNDEYVFQALSAGASGFLLKNSEAERMVEAVRTVAAGHALLAPEITRRVIRQMVDRGAGAGGELGAGASAVARGRAGLPSPSGGAASSNERRSSGGAASSNGALTSNGRPPSDGADGAIATLTPREREVLELVGTGLSNSEIAERLWLGEATVKTHVSNLLSKLHLRDRVQAVVLAHRHGLV